MNLLHFFENDVSKESQKLVTQLYHYFRFHYEIMLSPPAHIWILNRSTGKILGVKISLFCILRWEKHFIKRKEKESYKNLMSDWYVYAFWTHTLRFSSWMIVRTWLSHFIKWIVSLYFLQCDLGQGILFLYGPI